MLEVAKVISNARKAVSSGDFDTIKANLKILLEYKVEKEDELPTDERDSDLKKINATINNIEYVLNSERSRRKEISDKSKEYDDKCEKLDKCQELFEFYSKVLSSPYAKEFKYIENDSTKHSEAEYDTLRDFFESIQSELKLEKVPTNLSEVENIIESYKKDIDELAFEINKLNGVYDEKVAQQDLARATELSKEEETINDARKTRIKLRKDLKDKVPADEYKKYIGKNNSKEIDSKIAELKKIPQSKRTPQEKDLLKLLEQLKPLSTIKKLDPAKKTELDSLYTKYGVSSIEELNTVLSNHEVENNNEHEENSSKLITNALVEEANASPVGTKEGVRILKQLSANGLGQDLDEITTNLRQNGYMPYAGKDALVYARPVYKRSIFGKPKLKGMELVEESIESFAANPIREYNNALKELQKRSKLLPNGPEITNKDIKKMEKTFKDLIDNSRVDEAMKRIISVKTSMTRTDIANISSHLGKRCTVEFPGGDENYKVPHMEFKTKFFGFIQNVKKSDIDKPNEAIKAPTLNNQYLRNVNTHTSTPTRVANKNIVKDYSHHKDDDLDEI